MNDPDATASSPQKISGRTTAATATEQSEFSIQLGSVTWWTPGAAYERIDPAAPEHESSGGGIFWLDFFKPRSHGVQPVYVYDFQPIVRQLEKLRSPTPGDSGERGIDRVLDAVRSTRLGYLATDAIASFGVEIADERLREAADTYCSMRSVRIVVIAAFPNCLVTLRDRPEYWLGRPLDDPTRTRIRALNEPPGLEPFGSRLTFQDPVQRQWMARDRASTALDLASFVLLELSSTFEPAYRELADLLDREEEAYFSIIDAEALALDTRALQHTQRNFFQLGSVLSMFNRNLSSFSEQALDRGKWLGNFSERADLGQVQLNHRDALTAVQDLRQNLRASLDMMASTLASKQLVISYHHEQRAREQVRLAEEQRERNESFARAATLVATLILLPTLVATFYGANVGLPFRNRTLGTAVLLTTMILAGLLGWLLIRFRNPYR
jgi:Mg2+ and Co2+ transporter CorA